uniref:Gentian CONSTANS-like4 homolog n=1 Tax=Gentiana triflora TaxID=55190 RepID=A0A0K2SF31_GENTR|nr:gentian CONSTANS-like4 homolog [Gentiana triflora]
MAGETTWSLAGKPCVSCKSTTATIFCRADSAFLCVSCDSKIHAANKLASRHARVWVCEVCENAPATVTCKADAAALCATCDRDIHSANPLARRHERHPVIPFFDSAAAKRSAGDTDAGEVEFDDDSCSKGVVDVVEEEEADVEAGSWLLLAPNYNKDDEIEKSIDFLFNDSDPYLDMGLISVDQKPNILIDQFNHHDHHQQQQQQQLYHNSDGVVPNQSKNDEQNHHFYGGVVAGYPTYDMDYGAGSTKHFMYNFNSQCISQSVSSSSMEAAVVPDQNAVDEVSRTLVLPTPVSGLDREARVLRYREKRKNRKFEKTIRYASRKAYAETRPRIKGRFAKRTEAAESTDSLLLISDASSYGIVPTY